MKRQFRLDRFLKLFGIILGVGALYGIGYALTYTVLHSESNNKFLDALANAGIIVISGIIFIFVWLLIEKMVDWIFPKTEKK